MLQRLVFLLLIFSGSVFAENKICLTMIVKNEAKIIERCLQSVEGIIDYISICDTGSNDGTPEIIEKFMGAHNIPGNVHRHEWRNFGHNRTLSVEAAKETLKNLEAPLESTFLLLIDADMVICLKENFTKQDLIDDAYLVSQRHGSFSYYNVRLARASLPWKSIGVTHEYWSASLPFQRKQLDTLYIDDREDGGCKSDKFERDLKLLTQGLIDEPNNERYMFYLAKTYKALNNLSEAVRWFKARAEAGGFFEEIWYSQLMIGECYEQMGFWDQALHWYLEAYQKNGARAEPLHRIAKHYRLEGRNSLTYMFANHGLKIPYPKDQLLFISDSVYNYELDEEISIAGFYTPFKEQGFNSLNKLLLQKDVPGHVKDRAFKNALFYVQNLENAAFTPITFDLPLISEESRELYRSMNPTIQKNSNGYTVICRAVNFSQSGGASYQSLDPKDPMIRTKNFLLHYDKGLNLLSQKEIIEDLPRPRFPTKVCGLEDCRLITSELSYWFFATVYDAEEGCVSQVLCKTEDANVAKLTLLKGKNSPCEKNWLPFLKGGELFAIYKYNPFTVYKIDKESGNCDKVLEYDTGHDLSHFRGSAAPIPFDDGYLLLVHEVIFDTQRFYTHRFVYLDKDLKIVKVSKPFTFMHKGIEYCCGMTLNHEQNGCLLTIGIEDSQAFFCSIPVTTIRSLLNVCI